MAAYAGPREGYVYCHHCRAYVRADRWQAHTATATHVRRYAAYCVKAERREARRAK